MYTKSEQVTGEVEIWAVPRQAWDPKDAPPFKYQIGRSYYTGEVKVVTHQVTLEVPAGVNLYMAAMETLESAKNEAFKEYQQKAAEVDRQIAELRLLAAPTPAPVYEADDIVLSAEVDVPDPYDHADFENREVNEVKDAECSHGVPLSYTCTDCL